MTRRLAMLGFVALVTLACGGAGGLPPIDDPLSVVELPPRGGTIVKQEPYFVEIEHNNGRGLLPGYDMLLTEAGWTLDSEVPEKKARVYSYPRWEAAYHEANPTHEGMSLFVYRKAKGKGAVITLTFGSGL